MDIKTFRRATPSSVCRSGKIGQIKRSGKIGGLSEVCWASYRKTKGLIVRKVSAGLVWVNCRSWCESQFKFRWFGVAAAWIKGRKPVPRVSQRRFHAGLNFWIAIVISELFTQSRFVIFFSVQKACVPLPCHAIFVLSFLCSLYHIKSTWQFRPHWIAGTGLVLRRSYCCMILQSRFLLDTRRGR